MNDPHSAEERFLSKSGEQELLSAAKHAYATRRLRETIFGERLFADPAWDLLLELFIAGQEGRSISVKSACIAASAPATTALRYIAHLLDLGLLARSPHPSDARSTFLALSESGTAHMTEYFSRSSAARCRAMTDRGASRA